MKMIKAKTEEGESVMFRYYNDKDCVDAEVSFLEHVGDVITLIVEAKKKGIGDGYIYQSPGQFLILQGKIYQKLQDAMEIIKLEQ